MNRAYRLVWSHSRRTWIAASETARRRGKAMGARAALTTVAAALILTVAGPSMAVAATYTWDGGASTTNWSDVANWDPDGLPSASAGCGSCYDLLIFGDAAGGTLYNDIGWAYELQINAGSGAYTMAGTQSMETRGITNLSSNMLTISMNSITGYTTTWDAGSGGLTVTSPLSFSGKTLTITGSADTLISGNLADTSAFGKPSNTFTKTGTGKLTLSGTNDSIKLEINQGTVSIGSIDNIGNTGTLTLDGGTLQVTGTLTLGKGTTLNSGGGTFDTGSNSLTLSNTISGTGQLTKTGSGTLTLTGTNNYSGGTTVSAGTLQGTTSGLQGNIVNNSAVVFDQSTDGTYSGNMSGTGSLTKSGSGKVTLTGSNNYNGGTTISAGTLQGNSTSLQGNIVNNAALIFDQSTTGTYSGNISGSGSFTKSGSGTLTLSGSNSYTGGTTITAGTLRSGSANAFVGNRAYTINGGTLDLNGNALTVTSLSGSGGAISLGSATLTINQSSSTSFAGNISDTGALTKSGTGTLTLTGSNSYSGGTTVSTGTLQGDSGSLQGNITNNSSVIFNQGSDGTYAGNMSGSGTLTKSGSGTLFLTGSNTYTGSTTVSAGTLRVNGSTDSAVTVNNGTTLGGSGTVGSVTLNSGSTLAPGNSIGTLNVSGDITFSSGSTYQVEVDAAGNADKVVATGTANLNGATVQVQAASGTYANSTDYTIVTAGTINGTFGSVSSNLAFLNPKLAYDANNVYLNLTRNDISYSDVANNSNQRSIGNALTTIADNSPSGDMLTLINSINTLTGSGARQAYDSLSGVQHTGAQSLLLGSSRHFTGLLNTRSNRLAASPGTTASQPLRFAPIRLAYNGDLSDLQLASNGSTTGLMESDGSGFWLTPQGGVGSIEDTANASGLNYTWYGLYGGADTWLDNQRLVGFALGASRSDADPAAGDTTIDSLELAAYGRWQNDTRYLDASLNVGNHSTDTSRRVVVGSLNRTASADYDAQSLGLSLEAGQTAFEQNDQRMTPFVGLRYSRLSRGGFTETGADSANLTVDSNTQQSLQGRLGVRTEQHSESPSGQRLNWDVSLAFAREFLDNTGTLKAGFEGAPSTTFSIDGPALDRNRVQLAVGLTTDIGQRTSLRIGYDGELAGSDQSHTASANLRVAW